MPELNVLETHFWTLARFQRVLLYSAIHKAGYPNHPAAAHDYLDKRLTGRLALDLDDLLEVLEPYMVTHSSGKPTGWLDETNGVLAKVTELIQQDFGSTPDELVKRSDAVFDDDLIVRKKAFLPPAIEIWQKTLAEEGMSFKIVYEQKDFATAVLSDTSVTGDQKWYAIAVFSTAIEHIETLIAASLPKTMADTRPIQLAINRNAAALYMTVAPCFGEEAVRHALNNGIHLLDLPAVWLLEHALATRSKKPNTALAAKIVEHFPQFLGQANGLLQVSSAVKRIP